MADLAADWSGGTADWKSLVSLWTLQGRKKNKKIKDKAAAGGGGRTPTWSSLRFEELIIPTADTFFASPFHYASVKSDQRENGTVIRKFQKKTEQRGRLGKKNRQLWTSEERARSQENGIGERFGLLRVRLPMKASPTKRGRGFVASRRSARPTRKQRTAVRPHTEFFVYERPHSRYQLKKIPFLAKYLNNI